MDGKAARSREIPATVSLKPQTMIDSFFLATTPHLHFGAGKISAVPGAAKGFGPKVLLITGVKSFMSSPHGLPLLHNLKTTGLSVSRYTIAREPSPAIIDEAVGKFFALAPDCVIAIGGGSVLDAGKAISAMLPLNVPVKDFLEGVGTKATHPGVKVPFIAVPTTSGTGSEATKNAVISETGDNGYKRSLRHNNFVPDLAVVDPSLTVNCPPPTTASSGMDAFTQLLESYLSTAANPLTDALAFEGLRCISRSLFTVYHEGDDMAARTDMSLAAYLSGITLANAGLGVVHGFASPIGGYFDIPHGVICSALMGPANIVTVRKLRRTRNNAEALGKYAKAGRLFTAAENMSDDYYTDVLLSTIESLTKEMHIPHLSDFGVTSEHFEKIVQDTSNKNHPVDLHTDELLEVLALATHA
jgi:alcohol dehydrogenase class IV